MTCWASSSELETDAASLEVEGASWIDSDDGLSCATYPLGQKTWQNPWSDDGPAVRDGSLESTAGTIDGPAAVGMAEAESTVDLESPSDAE